MNKINIEVRIIENGWILTVEGKEYSFIDRDHIINKIKEILDETIFK